MHKRIVNKSILLSAWVQVLGGLLLGGGVILWWFRRKWNLYKLSLDEKG
jgi:hypothetical protein